MCLSILISKEFSLNSRIWITLFFCVSCLIFLGMALFTYCYDPYSYYRINDEQLKVSSLPLSNPGIVRNADYDTVIVGSSVMQNFDPKVVDEVTGYKTVKVSLSDLSQNQRKVIFELILREKKAERIFYGLDLFSLSPSHREVSGSLPDYLYNQSCLDDIKYVLGYENWFRFTPVLVGLQLASGLGFDVPQEKMAVSLDQIGNWDDGVVFSKDLLRSQYLKNAQSFSFSKAVTSVSREAMFNRADDLLRDLKNASTETEITVFFPPYSALYWNMLKERGLYDSYVDVKKHICYQLQLCEKVEVLDYQIMPLILNLDYYKDEMHYSKEVNDIMSSGFAEKGWLVRRNDIDTNIDELNDLILQFELENRDWLRVVD